MILHPCMFELQRACIDLGQINLFCMLQCSHSCSVTLTGLSLTSNNVMLGLSLKKKTSPWNPRVTKMDEL